MAILAAALALAACASSQPEERTPPNTAATAPLPAQSGFAMTSPRAQAPMPIAASDPHDICGSAKLRYLIGRPKSEIPVPLNPALRRVACTSCPVTMDFSPARLDILYDPETGIVKEVKCG
jgi:hypothetical protein